MATRSLIARKINSGKKVIVSYVHWDGYPEHVGQVLVDHYNRGPRVDALLALGQLSSIGAVLAPDTYAGDHSFDKPQRNVCVAYGRDRADLGTESQTVSAETFGKMVKEGFMGAEFVYLFDGNGWKVTDAHAAPDWMPVLARIRKDQQ